MKLIVFWQENKQLKDIIEAKKTATIVDVHCQLADRSHEQLLGCNKHSFTSYGLPQLAIIFPDSITSAKISAGLAMMIVL